MSRDIGAILDKGVRMVRKVPKMCLVVEFVFHLSRTDFMWPIRLSKLC